MKIFKRYTYDWWQIGLFKLALLSFGVVIGAFWHELFSQYLITLIIIGVVLVVYIGFVSIRQ